MTPHSLRVLAVGVCTTAMTVSLCGAVGPAAATATGRPAATHTIVITPQTRADLRTSMRGEAFAGASYHLFALEAAFEGHRAAAVVFRRAAAEELGEHFVREAALAGVVRDGAANLRAAIADEDRAAVVLYPRFAREARLDGDLAAERLFTEIGRDKVAHRRLLAAALLAIGGGGSIPVLPEIGPVAVGPVVPVGVRAARTLRNLDAAMHDEALGHARYRLFAAFARYHGRLDLARLWAVSAATELRRHFAAEAVLAGTVRGTRANLLRAIIGERYEAGVMYPRFATRARLVGELLAARVFRRNAVDEARHAAIYRRVLDRLR